MSWIKHLTFAIVAIVFLCVGCSRGAGEQAGDRQSGNGLTPLPFNKVSLEDDFWKPRLETQAKTLIPFALGKTTPAVEALEMAGDFLAGDSTALPTPHRYRSSDLYKVMEGAALLLTETPDPALERRLDKIIDIIARAQQDDGYLYVSHITGVSKDHDHWGGGGMGDKPYSFVLHSHELYNMGHMYEAAIAYYRATGKDKWLKVAEKNARHINKVFFEGDPDYNDGKPVNQAPGHQELELALVKLFRVTGDSLYLEMAGKFLDIRGKTYRPEGEGVMSGTYSHQHKPPAEQREAVGHAVRATYMYSAMADVEALTNAGSYNGALDKIWHNIVDSKMHITGGLGAVHGIEGFGPEYVLPNKEAYNETCAAVGNVFFNYRMFLLHGDARFMDVAEVSLFNNSLAGVNLEGNRFFYVNPLETDGTTPFNHGRPGRSPWFNTACCPSNIARLMPQVSGMMYAYSSDEVYVTLYASNSTQIPLKDGAIGIEQRSGYPFDGKVQLTFFPENKQDFRLKLRIPTWALTDQFVPGELYDYLHINNGGGQWSIAVNGEPFEPILEKGFAVIERTWSSGDLVELNIPMPVRFSKTIEQVGANQGKLAVTRGPLVYVAEGIDNGGPVQQFFLNEFPAPDQIPQATIDSGILKGVVKVGLPAGKVTGSGVVSADLQLIPYYAWNNREDGSMIVWFPSGQDQVQFVNDNMASGGKFKYVSASSTHQLGSLTAISGPRRPASSKDRTIQPWISDEAPDHWVEIGLTEARPIRSIGIYWFDFGRWNVKIPESWQVQYFDAGQWKAIDLYVTDDYAVDKDKYNVVHPGSDLRSDRLRIRIKSQGNTKVGILDVDIEYQNIDT